MRFVHVLRAISEILSTYVDLKCDSKHFFLLGLILLLLASFEHELLLLAIIFRINTSIPQWPMSFCFGIAVLKTEKVLSSPWKLYFHWSDSNRIFPVAAPTEQWQAGESNKIFSDFFFATTYPLHSQSFCFGIAPL